jgi:hypothetical protein
LYPGRPIRVHIGEIFRVWPRPYTLIDTYPNMRNLCRMSIVSRIMGAAKKYAQESTKPLDSIPNEKKIEKIEFENSRLKKANLEYFNLIERVLRQRDEWKNLYSLHVREHQNAQCLYEQEISKLRKMLSNCIKIANSELKANSKPEIQKPKDLGDLYDMPVGLVAEYAEKIAHARSLLENQIDGVAERDTIASK